jgi:O-succinylbenzoate synthase
MDCVKISSISVFAYRLPLARPLVLKSRYLTEREGLLVRVTSDSGFTSWGEAAPLPGFSRETITEARVALLAAKQELEGAELPAGIEQLDGEFRNWLGHLKLCPSAQFAIEAAGLGLLAKCGGMFLAGLLSDQPGAYVRVNGLITDDAAAADSARTFVSHDYRAVKMKVGHRTLDEDIARVHDLSHELPEGVTLRLDANRSWQFQEAVRFVEAVADCRLDYIEEPLADPSRLSELVKRTGVRVALDESLAGMTPEELSQHDYVSAIVLKPTLSSGLERTARFMRVAREMKIKAVVSSCFESAIGIAALAQFAAAHGSRDTPAGLDTLTWFKHDLLTEPLSVSGGRISIDQCAQVPDRVDMSLLTEVSDG